THLEWAAVCCVIEHEREVVLIQLFKRKAAYHESGLFFFTDPAPAEIYTLSLHDALPIYLRACRIRVDLRARMLDQLCHRVGHLRSEEHTSELQSRENLVCRLLLEKKNMHDAAVGGG